MKNAILAIATVFAIASLPALAKDFPKGSPKFNDSYSKVMSAAEKSGKPVILIFSASWCPPCQVMKSEVYPSKEIQAMHDSFEWAYIDVDDRKNEKAAAQFGVQGIPHIQFVDAKGNPLDKQIGGSSPKDFSARLKDVLTKAGKETNS